MSTSISEDDEDMLDEDELDRVDDEDDDDDLRRFLVLFE